MDPQSQLSGSAPPPKPWERAGSTSSGPAPFKPASAGNTTSAVVEASGTAKPGEIVSAPNTAGGALARPLTSRPWDQPSTTNPYAPGYGPTTNYGTANNYGSGMYRTSYGGLGGGAAMYGNSMYRGGYGAGGLHGSTGMYGAGSMYGAQTGGYGMGGYGMGGYGMGMGMGMGMGGGAEDPNDPYGPPSAPPGFWLSVLHVMQGVVNFFGRISILVDQNTQAFHLFMTALLQLFDRSGVLYGELAKFVFRILGFRSKNKRGQPQGQLPGPHNQNFIEGPSKAPPAGNWDNVWGNDANH